MSRRSRRLSEAKDALSAMKNGELSVGRKKSRMDAQTSDCPKGDQNSDVRKENQKVTAANRALNSNLKDMPLKERLKIDYKRSVHECNAETNVTEPTNERLRDFGVDNKASTSNIFTEDTATVSDLNAPESESLAVILSQGLTSSDAEKIDAVLSKSDMRTISATLNNLPVVQIIPLLREIEYRYRNRRHLDSCWVLWLQCVLSKHMAYLCTISTLKEELSSLFSWFKKRISHVDELLQLSGKLSLVNEQINRRMCPQVFITQQPTVFFEDNDDALSESCGDLNDADEKDIESVEEWWDDEEVGSNENDSDDEDMEEEEEEEVESGSSDEYNDEHMDYENKGADSDESQM